MWGVIEYNRLICHQLSDSDWNDYVDDTDDEDDDADDDNDDDARQNDYSNIIHRILIAYTLTSVSDCYNGVWRE